MKLKYTAIGLVSIIILLATSCRDYGPDVLNPDKRNSFENWSDVFESYWYGMNYSYAFWDVDSTDWDEVYATYKPQFEGLEFYNEADSLKVKELFGEITSGLIDHHYTLVLKKGNGENFAGYWPNYDEVETRDYYHESIDQDNLTEIIESMESEGRVTHLYGVVRPDMTLYSALIDESVVYFRLSNFMINSYLGDENVEDVLYNYYYLIDNVPDLKGIIIDSRSNNGGALNDMNLIVTPLLAEDLLFMESRTKTGMGRLDYTPWTPNILFAQTPEDRYIKRDVRDIPVISLVDINSMSMGEMIAIAISEMPNGIVMGERTFGGLGMLNGDINQYYTGTIENSAFRMYTTTSMSRRLDGKCYEGIGISPDIEVLFDEEAFKAGHDTQLERALEYIKTGK